VIRRKNHRVSPPLTRAIDPRSSVSPLKISVSLSLSLSLSLKLLNLVEEAAAMSDEKGCSESPRSDYESSKIDSRKSPSS